MADLPKARELRVETCHAKAAECRELAKRSKKASDAIMFEHMAETWERIAADIVWVGEQPLPGPFKN